ncbi:hypothetical protein N7537_005807 [Penicillium hordei]|uniref:Uncharacterized protein n=1 Tax=Penicillium hordei TaxID=40994 RepID=A0AAD6E6V2_9EURO|nr:uncharacterized protein N7537_005807 [Penicillium hordei]KAJ5602851.1 hypothetical protein N7537_005807 [Penicillium hordei]
MTMCPIYYSSGHHVQRYALLPVAAAVTKSEITAKKLIETVVDYTVDSNVASPRAILGGFWRLVLKGPGY